MAGGARQGVGEVAWRDRECGRPSLSLQAVEAKVLLPMPQALVPPTAGHDQGSELNQLPAPRPMHVDGREEGSVLGSKGLRPGSLGRTAGQSQVHGFSRGGCQVPGQEDH